VRAALDSNVMIYAENLSEDSRCEVARTIITTVDLDAIIIPAQSLAEMLQWLMKKARRTRQEAAESAAYWRGMFRLHPTTEAVMQSAISLLVEHQFQVFDAIILASAAEAGADMLLSEDMQHGFRWQGVTVVNPFLPEAHPLLKALTLSKT
jgi:predicted nucleic acid-binding protein